MAEVAEVRNKNSLIIHHRQYEQEKHHYRAAHPCRNGGAGTRDNGKGDSLPMAFAQQVMLADSITKNSVCYATVYDANENRLAFKFVVSHDLLPLHFS